MRRRIPVAANQDRKVGTKRFRDGPGRGAFADRGGAAKNGHRDGARRRETFPRDVRRPRSGSLRSYSFFAALYFVFAVGQDRSSRSSSETAKQSVAVKRFFVFSRYMLLDTRAFGQRYVTRRECVVHVERGSNVAHDKTILGPSHAPIEFR